MLLNRSKYLESYFGTSTCTEVFAPLTSVSSSVSFVLIHAEHWSDLGCLGTTMSVKWMRACSFAES